jgi:GT2 family glycosyltransferase
MLYIGSRPTLDDAGNQTIELNILDFDGDLYGQALVVKVLDFIRSDKKLDDLKALKNQIEEDKKEIQKRLSPTPTLPKGEGENAPLFGGMGEAVAVVILNYNTRRHLEQFLPSVVANSPGARIIVADNGSPDDSVEFLKKNYPEVEVIDLQQNYGFAEGYNRALNQVKADIYVILNSDVEVASGWMTPILETMRNDPAIAIAQPKILAWSEKNRFEYAGAAGGWLDTLGYPFCRGRIFSHREEDWGQYDAPQECFWAAGAAFFIRADLYHAFGGFDGDYFAHNEEIDLCWRLKRAGYSVWCIPQSVVYHLGGGTLEYENPRKVFLNFRNSLYSLLKNKPFRKLLWLVPARLLLDGLAGVRFALKGQFKAIWAIVRAHFSFYANFKNTIRKRREAVEIIDKHKFRPENRSGIYPGSVIVAYYAKRIKQFSKL